MNHEEIRAVVGRISYKSHWQLRIRIVEDGGAFIWWHFPTIDVKTRVDGIAQGRKWRISPYAVESEVVQTALAAALACEEHEAREFFQYEGRRVFNPHISVRALMEVCDREEARE